jgi:hypothetical protein
MKLATIVNPKFQKALSNLLKNQVPIKTAFKLKGILQTVSQELSKYEALRSELLQRYGSKDETGKLIRDKAGKVALEGDGLRAFSDELNQLVDLDLDIPSIKLEELGDKVQLSVEELMVLGDLIIN